MKFGSTFSPLIFKFSVWMYMHGIHVKVKKSIRETDSNNGRNCKKEDQVTERERYRDQTVIALRPRQNSDSDRDTDFLTR